MRLILLMSLLALTSGTAVATAQEAPKTEAADTVAVAPMRIANGTRFGVWTVTCEALAVNETACVLSQRLVRKSDNAFLAEVLAFQSADGARRYMAARVPNGVYLPAGFAMKPAEGEAEETRFVWQSCSRELCEALIDLDDAKIAELESGERLVAGYRPSLVAQPLVFAMGATGLKEGLDALAASSGKKD